MKRIGIDVGGTNTDAVLIEGSMVLAAVKSPTTQDVMTGVVTSVRTLLEQAGDKAGGIGAVMIGTTHFTNAVVERARLDRVAAIRIAMPAGASLPPMVDWPEDLRQVVNPLSFMVEGGHEYDGRPLVPLDRRAIREAAEKIGEAGISAIGITALFSPLTAECEQEAAEIIAEVLPEAHVTLSHRLGRIGLLERENVTLLNASLQSLGRSTVAAFRDALASLGVNAPFYLTQNDGTVVLAEIAAENPVYSFASGPTNSMRGAAMLSGLQDGMVVDVGGTTSDVGCLVHGFPREANNIVEIGGVRTLFRMPDLLPMALGGGTIIDSNTGKVGPRSVGYRITEKALIFGGDTLTATDIAVAAGIADIGDKTLVRRISKADADRHLASIHRIIEEGVDKMKTSAGEVPLIVVGGGAFLVPRSIMGVSKVLHVEHAGVANALGAAMAQISGEVDQVFSGMGRDAALSAASEIATQRAIESGAAVDSIKIVDSEDIPLAYLPGDSRRVRVRVVGTAQALSA